LAIRLNSKRCAKSLRVRRTRNSSATLVPSKQHRSSHQCRRSCRPDQSGLVLHHEQIPATLHFKTPNPKIDFASSPFMIATSSSRSREENKSAALPSVRLVSVAPTSTSFSKKRLRPMPLRRPQARRSPAAFATLCQDSGSPRGIQPRSGGASCGRRSGSSCRRCLHLSNRTQADGAPAFRVAADSSEAAKLLLQPNPLRCSTKRCERRNPPVVFLFGGQGTQYVNMARTYIATSPFFAPSSTIAANTLSRISDAISENSFIPEWRSEDRPDFPTGHLLHPASIS